MNSTLKHYIVSSVITFSSVFLLAVTSVQDISFTKTSIVALLVVATRAGLKAVSELLPTFITK